MVRKLKIKDKKMSFDNKKRLVKKNLLLSELVWYLENQEDDNDKLQKIKSFIFTFFITNEMIEIIFEDLKNDEVTKE